MDKVRVIERSLACFVAGCLAIIPVLGILPAVIAIHLHQSVLAELGRSWNPARSYLLWGGALGWTGIIITILAVGSRFL